LQAKKDREKRELDDFNRQVDTLLSAIADYAPDVIEGLSILDKYPSDILGKYGDADLAYYNDKLRIILPSDYFDGISSYYIYFTREGTYKILYDDHWDHDCFWDVLVGSRGTIITKLQGILNDIETLDSELDGMLDDYLLADTD
jgi:hypothetical protein